MRTLHLVHDFNVEGAGGGVSRFGISLAQKLAELGLEIGLAALWQTETGREAARRHELQQHGVRTFVLGKYDEHRSSGSFLQAAQTLRTLVHKEQLTALHSHTEFCDIAMLGALFSPSPPALYRTVHYGYAYEWRKRPERRLIFTHILLPLLMTREIGISPVVTANLDRRPLARLLRKPSLYIPNALDIDRFRNVPPGTRLKIRAELGLTEADIVFGSVGRLSVQKGFSFFVEAAALVLKSIPNACFMIAGEGEDEAALRAQIAQLGIGERFRLLGPIAQIETLFPVFDFFVSSSLWEGLPTVIMEAFAARIPVIATDVAGSNVLVKAGETGWLCSAGSAEGLAAAMLTALSETGRRQAYLDHALRHVQSFSIEAVARRYLQLYQTD